MRNRWLWILFVIAVVWGAFSLLSKGHWLLGTGYAVVGIVAAWWTSPLRGRNTVSHQEVAAMSDTDSRRDVIIYWRPGCPFCSRLRTALGKKGDDATWINIWQDEEGAEFVRSVNDGNETVPTVVMDGEPFTNPEPSTVLARLEQG